METRRWTNQAHPQTLQVAVFLLYAQAVFALIPGFGGSVIPSALDRLGMPSALTGLVGILLIVGYAGSAFGIANDRRIGYQVAVGIAGAEVASWLIASNFDVIGILTSSNIISVMFDIARFALLIHPMSRGYQKLWFS